MDEVMGLPYNIATNVGKVKPVAMKFIINGMLEYDPSNCSLTSIATGDDIQLSQTSSRLLKYLIEHNQQIVPREMIFEKVWDDFGMRASNPNLNQHISFLRKEFTNLGCSRDLIKTLPKIGFSLDAEIDIRVEDKTTKNETRGEVKAAEAPAEDDATPVAVKAEGTDAVRHSLWGNKGYATVTLGLLLFVAVLMGILSWNKDLSTKATYPLGSYRNCSIYSLHEVDARNRGGMLKEYASLLHKEDINCDKPSSVYVSGDNRMASNASRLFFSVCDSVSTGHCASRYSYNNADSHE